MRFVVYLYIKKTICVLLVFCSSEFPRCSISENFVNSDSFLRSGWMHRCLDSYIKRYYL